MSEPRDCFSCQFFETTSDAKPCADCLEYGLTRSCYKPKTMRRLVILTAAVVLIMFLLIILGP